jgi:adenine-specific DNA-methyltransferase
MVKWGACPLVFQQNDAWSALGGDWEADVGVQIRYMGSKYDLAPLVLEVTKRLPSGPFLDVFAGMCSVAGNLAPSGRPVWTNDIQTFATEIATALLCSKEIPPSPTDASLLLFDDYRKNIDSLGDRFAKELDNERTAIADDDSACYASVAASWRHVGNSLPLLDEARELRQTPSAFPYRLATLYFAHGYFGLGQSLEFDSLRYAIDTAFTERRLSRDGYRWSLVALLQAASHLSTSPGHFAQYLNPCSSAAYRYIREKRTKSVWAQFQIEIERLSPYGSADWRRLNRVFNSDGTDLCIKLKRRARRPRIVYADPPYSKDQYSRYYHVLETLLRYDYPDSAGVGRYRADRFHTPFSVKTQVVQAFAALARAVASLDGILLLSYPSNGLLYKVSTTPELVLAEYYTDVQVIHEFEKKHSTLGGAHGSPSQTALERLFIAKGVRS